MEVLTQLLGRLHPLVVHLPIGFIIVGLLLLWHYRKENTYPDATYLVFLWGGYSATLACLTGYLQYLGEGYAFDTVKLHLWSGMVTALFSFVMYARLRKLKSVDFLSKIPLITLSILTLSLISFTGHQGGNITHGADYLVAPLPNNLKKTLGFETSEEKEIVLTEDNWEKALLYDDVVAPILHNTCVSCHNPKKTKGGLLLHNEAGILAGGDNGTVLIAEASAKSDVFIRMNLPLAHQDHMPPEGKKQPSKEEIALVGAWIDAGHPFEGTVQENGLEKKLFTSFFTKKQTYDYPSIEITKAAPDSILLIKQTGVHVDPISKSTAFLSVSCLNKPSFSDSDFETLLPIANNIAILDLGHTQVSDAIFKKLVQLPHLTVLQLDHTGISGKGIITLNSLAHLKSINLTGSGFEQAYLNDFSGFKNLQQLYLYKTKVPANTSSNLNTAQISIDYGNYSLPPIASDSIIY